MADQTASRARRKIERQAKGMFAVALLLTIASVTAYILAGDDDGAVDVGSVQISNLTVGLMLGVAALLAGLGAIRSAGAKDESEPADLESQAATQPQSARSLNRRRLIQASVAGVLALLPAVLLLRALAPATAKTRSHTVWAPGVRLLTDVSGRPLRPADLEVGQLVNVAPESLDEVPAADGKQLNARAKAAVVVVRMEPQDVVAADGRENWHVDGIVAYSKICTHVGCPMGLYERTTKHLLCPCHQSTFDLADSGTVLFGPATRSLPQLPLAVDDDGYLVAQSDFTEPVGPSYWER